MLDLFDDANIYQTWSYGGVRWGEENLSHLVLKRHGEVRGLAQLRIVRPTPLKFGMAYLRWGPMFERRGIPSDPDVIAALARFLEAEYVSKRKLFLRMLPNAFAGTPRAAAIQAAFGRFTPEVLGVENTYRTFVVDISPSFEDLRKKLDKKWRNQLTTSEKNDLRVVQADNGDGCGEAYRTFRGMYKQMRRRKTFETSVDVDEFGRIQQDLPESHRMLVLICEHNGVPVAGLVASAMGDTAIYLLGATSDEGLKSKGAYLLQWTLMKLLKERGVRRYDLGGIDPEGNPGVYHFKRGLSGADVTQINPLIACDSVISSAIVRASLAMHRTVHVWKGNLHFARQASPELTRA